MKRTLTVTLVMLATTFAWAGKPIKMVTEREATDVTFSDAPTDVIQSDGRGTYETFVDGFEAYSEYQLTEFVGGSRRATLNLGTFVSGDPTVNPSGAITEIQMKHSAGVGADGLNPETEGERDISVPAPGESLVASAEHPHNVTFFFRATDGEEYAIYTQDEEGRMSLSAHDFDDDGRADARSINVPATMTWRFYKKTTETVVVGSGKKQTTEERVTYDLVAEYTDMSLNLWLDLLGFRVTVFNFR